MRSSTRSGATLREIEAVYTSRFPELASLAAAILRDRDAGRDSVQEAFAKAVRTRAEFRGDGSLDAWLWRAVVNTALDEQRRRAREVERLASWDPPASNGHRGAPNAKHLVGAAFFARHVVEAKFAEGGLLLDEPAFKIDAGRRVAPGEVEYHQHAVDVMRVVAGTAKVVTGGEMREAHEVAPGEVRAERIEGGTTHDLHEGDVLAIPNGVPHQFTEVSDPFLYFVVKVAA